MRPLGVDRIGASQSDIHQFIIVYLTCTERPTEPDMRQSSASRQTRLANSQARVIRCAEVAEMVLNLWYDGILV